MASTNNPATVRNSYTSQIDMEVMKQAAILPWVDSAKSLLYRSPNLTNVFVQSWTTASTTTPPSA